MNVDTAATVIVCSFVVGMATISGIYLWYCRCKLRILAKAAESEVLRQEL